MIIAGNAYLADWYSQYNANVRIVHTAIDTARFVPAEHEPDAFVIGWTGSSWTLPYLESIEDSLHQFMSLHPDSKIRVIADRAPAFQRINARQVEYVSWSPENEAVSLRGMSVGLMPLPDDDWTRGKCSFKMLQYMSCGIPTVVSPVGLNADILHMGDSEIAVTRESDWVAALDAYYTDTAKAREAGKIGRQIVEQHFSRRVITEQLAEIFHSLV